jgi:cytosine/adenosine deaminase-related metal-dependent hydrolase
MSLANIVFSLERTAIKDVYVGGRQVIADGRHPLQANITADFKGTQKELWWDSR